MAGATRGQQLALLGVGAVAVASVYLAGKAHVERRMAENMVYVSDGADHLFTPEEQKALQEEQRAKVDSTCGDYESDIMASYASVKWLVQRLYMQIFTRIPHPKVHESAPDARVLRLWKDESGREHREVVSLLSFAHKGRPLVLNFGSASVAEWKDLQRGFGSVADFVNVYITEAHPTDEWSLRANEEAGVNLAQPKQLEERIANAREFSEREEAEEMELVIDLMDDNANIAYTAWPERLYILLDGRLEYVGGCGPFGYLTKEVRRWLEHHKAGQ